MPSYDYNCPACDQVEEITHSIKEDPELNCGNCGHLMKRQIGMGAYVIAGGINGSVADYKESEHNKKVKDPERAVRSRKKAFGHDAVGDPGMTTDPRHVVRRGRTLGGQQKDIDKGEFIKAAAKDDHIVNEAIKAVKNSAGN